MADEKYPRWRERWNERVHDIDNEIVNWWERTRADIRGSATAGEAASSALGETQRAGDRIADRAAGRNDPETVAERVGDTGRNWWARLKNDVTDWFHHEDDEVKAEYRQAFNDDDYIGQRFEERRAELQRQGKLPS